jgi:hypothetical protein
MVLKRWMKVVRVMNLPPVGPCCDPTECRTRRPIAPAFGQLASEPAAIDASCFAHTLLLSKELRHVALPKGSGFGGELVGVCIGAEEVGAELDVLPKETRKKGWLGGKRRRRSRKRCLCSRAGKHSLAYRIHQGVDFKLYYRTNGRPTRLHEFGGCTWPLSFSHVWANSPLAEHRSGVIGNRRVFSRTDRDDRNLAWVFRSTSEHHSARR